MIVVKMECWHKSNRAWKTQGWTSINNNNNNNKGGTSTGTSTGTGTDDRHLEFSNQQTFEDGGLWKNSSSVKTERATPDSSKRATQDSSASTNYDRKERRILGPDDDYCNSFQFQYAVNGDITTLDKEAFLERKYEVGKNVELLTIMDYPAYTGGQNKDVQIAIRMLGCGRRKVFKLTHVYWA